MHLLSLPDKYHLDKKEVNMLWRTPYVWVVPHGSYKNLSSKSFALKKCIDFLLTPAHSMSENPMYQQLMEARRP